MRLCSLIAAAALASGCANVAQTPYSAPAPERATEHIVEKSYVVGKEASAFVGGTMARVKDYNIDKITRRGAMHASTDFTLFYPIIGPRVLIRTTDPIPIVGTTERDGVMYRLVALPQVPTVKLLITEDGRFEGSGLGLGNARMGYNYTPSPQDVQLRPDTSTSTLNTAAGFINFEIVYSGVTKDSIRLHYREYTPNDLVRPAFSQDLTYERDSPTIRFRNVLFRVIEATGERIRYIVLEDGYQK